MCIEHCSTWGLIALADLCLVLKVFSQKRAEDPAFKELTDMEMDLFIQKAIRVGLPEDIKEQPTLPQFPDKKCPAVYVMLVLV